MTKPERDSETQRWSLQSPVALPSWAVLLFFGLMVGYVAVLAPYAWIPHDDGTLSHSADRILHGELPHRDFDDAYTGGLSFWHALAFRLCGTNLYTLRLVLLLVAIGFMACFYRLARLFADPAVSLLSLGLAVAWSLPNYFAAMPSWYITFFALFSSSLILQFDATRKWYWLLLAGVLGGLGLLVKIQALFYIGAVLLSLAFLELHRNACESGGKAGSSRPGNKGAYAIFLGMIALAYMGLLVLLVRRHLGPMELLTYVVPTAILCAALVSENGYYGNGRFAERLLSLCRWTVIYVLGLLAPIICMLWIYWTLGAADEFISGVLAIPAQWIGSSGNDETFAWTRFAESAETYALPHVSWFLTALPFLLLMLLEFSRFKPGAAMHLALYFVLAAVFVAAMFLISVEPVEDPSLRLMEILYPTICYSFRCAAPALTMVIGMQLLDRKRRGRIPPERRKQMFVLGMVATQVSLMQYPNSTAVYFFYVAPLFVIAGLALVATMRTALRPAYVGVVLFYLAFALVWLNTGFIRSHGVRYFPAREKEKLAVERGGILVSSTDRSQYEMLVNKIRANTDSGERIYAAPDCPEVYFLADRPNPSRALFDVIMDPEGSSEAYVQQLLEWDVRLVVVNLRPEFSREFPETFLAELRRAYPRTLLVTPKFMVFAR